MKARPEREQLPQWQQRFLVMLPTIVDFVVAGFRNLRPEEKAEAVQEAIANCFSSYCRLVQRGKESVAFASVLARFAIAQVRTGRQVGGRLNIKDVSSSYAQNRKQFYVERLDRFDADQECWKEALVEDRRTPVPDQVWFRIDFPAWLTTLSPREQKIAKALAEGDRTTDVARRFGLSMARISQLRRELFDSWQRFHGEVDERDRMELLAAA